MGGPENGNFPLLYVVKTILRRWVGGSKSLKTPLTSKKMASNNEKKLISLDNHQYFGGSRLEIKAHTIFATFNKDQYRCHQFEESESSLTGFRMRH